MTTLVKIAIAVLISLFLSSCGFDIQIGNFGTGKKGNGVVVNDTRSVTEDFTKVSASEGLMVYVTQADEFSIKVEADENVIDLIETDIRDGKLRIHTEENIAHSSAQKVMVEFDDIQMAISMVKKPAASLAYWESTQKWWDDHFQPICRDAGVKDKGALMLYMQDTYGFRLSRQNQKLYAAWNNADPPDAWQIERDQRIGRQQGKANEYVSTYRQM